MPTTFISPQKLNALSLSEGPSISWISMRKLSQTCYDLKSIAPMVDDLDAMREKLIQAGTFIADDDP